MNLITRESQNEKKWDTQILNVLDEKAYVGEVKDTLTT